MVDVCDPVDDPDDLAFQSGWVALPGVGEDAVAHFLRQVERFGNPEGLLVVAKPAAEPFLRGEIECILTRMAERWVPRVVPQPDRFDEVFVEAERPCHSARDAGRLERVSHARAVMVTGGIDENLRLPFETAERLRVEDPVSVALERRPQPAILLVP